MKKYTLPIILLAVSFFNFAFRLSEAGGKKHRTKPDRSRKYSDGTAGNRSTGRITGTGRGGKGSGRTYRSRYFRGKFRGKELYSECPFVYGDSEWKL